MPRCSPPSNNGHEKLRVDTRKLKAAPLPKRAQVRTPKMSRKIRRAYAQVKKQYGAALRALADT